MRISDWSSDVCSSDLLHPGRTVATPDLQRIIARAVAGDRLDPEQIVRLFEADGPDVALIASAADALRRDVIGDDVTYVINRNIHYTNICPSRFGFCDFSKGLNRDITGPEIRPNLE